MTLKYLIQKEFLQLFRNPFLPKFVFVFPIVMMCVMPWVMNMEVKNIRVDVVDNDRSTESQRLIHQIEASRYFILNGQSPSYQDALDDVERTEADVILEIPPHYHRDLMRGAHPQIHIAANAVNGVKGGLASNYLVQMVQDAENTATNGMQIKIETAGSLPQILYLYNKHLDYKRYTIPAMFAILILLVCGALPALNIVGEKESGTIEAINVTPVSKYEFILAKLIPYWLIGGIVITEALTVSWLVYGITPSGNIALIYLLALLWALTISGFGLVLSNYNRTMQQAMFVLWFFVMLFMLMSGLFTPTRSMPEWAYAATFVNPLCYFINGMRTVFVRGGDLASIAPQVLALSISAAVMDTWAILSYKKR